MLYNKIFTSVIAAFFIIMFLAAPGYKLLSKLGIIEFQDKANYIDREREHEGLLSGGLNFLEDIKANLTDTYINYLPFYTQIVGIAADTKFMINEPTIQLLSDMSVKLRNNKSVVTDTVESNMIDEETIDGNEIAPEIPDTSPKMLDLSTAYSRFYVHANHHRFYILGVDSTDGEQIPFFDKVVEYNYTDSIKRADKNLSYINNLAASNTDVNFYVYMCTRLQDTPMAEYFFPDELASGEVTEYFRNGLDERIIYDHFKMESIEHRLETVYMTDHHWSADGVRQGYTEIVNMLYNNTPEIGEPREPVEYYEIEGLKYFGANARTMSYYQLSEPFTFYDFGLPHHVITGGIPFETSKNNYLSGKYDSAQGVDHYGVFYRAGEKYHYPNNNTGRNLLIIGDSYSLSVAEIIASHYDYTYFRDIRTNTEMNYNKYISDRNITDVLVLQITSRLVFDVVNDSRWQLIKTD